MAYTDYILTAEDNDILTTEGGVELLAFQVNTQAISYGFAVDWDGDSNLDDVNEAERVLRWSCERGRERIFQSSGNGFNPYEVGRLSLTLDNYDGRYNPWNAAGPLYGNIMPGRNMQFKVALYSSTSANEHDSYFVFTGTIVDIRLTGHNKTAELVCEDGWRYLADKNYYREPLTTGGSGVGGELRRILVLGVHWDYKENNYRWDYHYLYPWGVAFTTVKSSTDLPRHWGWDGSAKSAVEMITFGSLGRSWIKSDGRFDFADFRESTDAAVATLDEDALLRDIYMPMPWDNLRSEVVLNGTNNIWYGGDKTVATLDDVLKIDAGQTIEFSLNYSYGDISDISCTKVTAVSIKAFENVNGTGTDISDDIDEDVYPGEDNIRIVATNRGATSGYITAFTVTGEPLTAIDTTWRYERFSNLRNASFKLTNPWLSVTAVGSGTYVSETSTTMNDRARINTVGKTLLTYLSTPKACPVVQIQGRYAEQFSLELEDKIRLTSGTLGIDDDFRISKIAHKSIKSTQDIQTRLWLYPVLSPVEST